MYKLKEKPEDFIVKELIDLKLENGKYSYFLLKKRNLTTHQAINIISKKLNINLKEIGYAGLKDKKAITSQYISINGDYSNFFINESNLYLEYIGTGKEPINLGSLNSNYFEIFIRNIDSTPEKIKSFPNYFDEQRFSKNNSEIGKLLIKKDFKNAFFLLKQDNHEELSKYSDSNENNLDYISAINKLPKKMLMLYLHSYQSLLFNQSLNEYIKTNFPYDKKEFNFGELAFTKEYDNSELELPGFDSKNKLPDDISPRDFIIRQLPNLSLESQKRKSFVILENLEFSELQEDELNEGKKKILVKFTLPKGSYATMLVKSLFV